MSETRKVAAILVADIVGYSRLTGADEERTLARLRALRSDLIDPTIAIHNGRLVKRTGDGAIVEFRSVVEAVRAAVEVQNGIAERNAGLSPDKRIEVRVGIHLGDVVEEADGDLMGDGVNVAARLEAICEPGGICISEDTYHLVRDRLDEPFVDLGAQSLKNIARPVRAYMLKGGALAGKASAAAPKARTKAILWPALAALIVALIAAGLSERHFLAPKPTEPTAASSPATDHKLANAPRLSIVVLPFANLSADPEQDYFADGLSDDLTTDLAKIRYSFVVGRGAASTYRGKAVDARQVGRDLGVRYVLEGSVRRIGDTITVNTQLISAETGDHIWADRFEGDRARFADLRVEAAARIANALLVQLIQAESRRATREWPNALDAIDLSIRGWATFLQPSSRETVEKAIGDFEQALRLDPDNPVALIGRALARLTDLFAFQSGDWDLVFHDGEEAANRVLAKHPDDATAHFTKALVARGRGLFDASLVEFDAAIRSDRNFAEAYAEKAFVMILLGRPQEAFPLVEQALRLDPLSPSRSVYEYFACDAHAHLAHWELVVEWCSRSTASNPSSYWPYYDLAAAYGWLGREREGAVALFSLKDLRRFVTVQDYLDANPDLGPEFNTARDRIAEGLHKAGLPQH